MFIGENEFSSEFHRLGLTGLWALEPRYYIVVTFFSEAVQVNLSLIESPKGKSSKQVLPFPRNPRSLKRSHQVSYNFSSRR